MADVHPGRTVVGPQVVPILGAEPVKAGTGHRIVAGSLDQRFCPSIVERVFQPVGWSLAQSYLAGVVIHLGSGLGERYGATLPHQCSVGSDRRRWKNRGVTRICAWG